MAPNPATVGGLLVGGTAVSVFRHLRGHSWERLAGRTLLCRFQLDCPWLVSYREMVMSKLASCCRPSANVSYKYSKVNKEEEADENETEWLMEEVQAPTPRPRKEGQENGHITTKSVKAEALTSLHGDDQDSEDEVLTIPEVRVHSGRGTGVEGAGQVRHPPRKMLRERADDRAGLVRGGKVSRGAPRPAAPKPVDSGSLASFHDDSDEDLLHI